MCMGLLQRESFFGLAQDAMLGAACILPQRKSFPSAQVIDAFLALGDELT